MYGMCMCTIFICNSSLVILLHITFVGHNIFRCVQTGTCDVSPVCDLVFLSVSNVAFVGCGR